MNDVTIDINIAKGIVEMLGQLQFDYAHSKARNQMVEHVVDRLQAQAPGEPEDTNGD